MAKTLDRPVSGAERPSAVAYFLVKMFAVASNTFTEGIRQPVYGIIVGVGALMIVTLPVVNFFSLTSSMMLIKDMGLATIMLAGLLLATFSASNVIALEIENRTVLTVISKPIGRIEFILGKFLGVVAGLGVGIYLLSIVLILTVSTGAMEGETENTISWPQAFSMIAALVLSVGYGIYANFFLDRPFASRAIGAATVLFTIALIVFLFWNPKASEQEVSPRFFSEAVDFQIVCGSIMVLWAVLILASIAVALSTRLTVVVNVTLCSAVFVLGLLSDYLFRGRDFDIKLWPKFSEALTMVFKGVYHIIPNLQVFWTSNYITSDVAIGPRYLLVSGAYALCHVLVFLFLAMLLFQERQVA